MATLEKLVSKFGATGTARIFQEHGHDVTEGRIREARKAREGRSLGTPAARKKRAELEGYAREVNLRKEYRKGPPGPEVVSAKVISSPVRTVLVDTKHARYATVESGRYPHIDRANNTEKWDLPPRDLHKESLIRLLQAGNNLFGGREVRVKLYGRFLHYKANYRMSARGGAEGWKEDFYQFNTSMASLIESLAQANRDVTREMNATTDPKERKLIENGDAGNLARFQYATDHPGPVARWAGIASPVKVWSDVTYVSIAPVLPTVKSRM